MHRVGTAYRLWRSLRQPEIAHLALPHEVAHRADGVLDRHRAIHSMLIVQIDVVDAQPRQRGVARGADVLGATAHPEVLAIRPTHVAELGGEDYALALAPYRPPHEDFVRVRAVHVGGVEESDAQLERAVDGCDRFLIIASSVKLGHPHAPEAERGNLESLSSKLALLHAHSSLSDAISITKRYFTSPLAIRRYASLICCIGIS